MKTRHTSDPGGHPSKRSRNLKRRVQDMEIGEAILEYPKYHDMNEPQEPVETILGQDSHNSKPAWAWELLREAERFAL